MEHFDKGLIEVLAFQAISFTARKCAPTPAQDIVDNGALATFDESKYDDNETPLTSIFPNKPLWR